jgi:hypothetical protein
MTDLLQTKWHRLGWQGVQLTVPEDWNIGGIGGGQEEGYLRIQDAEMPRVELKWATSTGFVNIDAAVEGYLKKIRQDRSKDKNIEVDTDATVVSKRKMRKKILRCFSWRSEVHGLGAAWYCAECKRTFIAQILSKPEEDGANLAERILGSIQDHPADGWIRWATYNFDAQVPEDFSLTARKLMAGHIQLTFKRDVAADTARSIILQNLVVPEELTLARWGMAGTILKNKTLQQWAADEMGTRLKRIKPELEPTETNGHEAIRVSATNLSLQGPLFRTIARFAEVPYADRIRGLVWHCPQSNSVHLVQMLIDYTNEELLTEIATRFTCHGGDETFE